MRGGWGDEKPEQGLHSGYFTLCYVEINPSQSSISYSTDHCLSPWQKCNKNPIVIKSDIFFCKWFSVFVHAHVIILQAWLLCLSDCTWVSVSERGGCWTDMSPSLEHKTWKLLAMLTTVEKLTYAVVRVSSHVLWPRSCNSTEWDPINLDDTSHLPLLAWDLVKFISVTADAHTTHNRTILLFQLLCIPLLPSPNHLSLGHFLVTHSSWLALEGE